jgi:hypothetical protein
MYLKITNVPVFLYDLNAGKSITWALVKGRGCILKYRIKNTE